MRAEDGVKFVESVKKAAEAILQELEGAKDASELLLVESCPVRVIREVKEDGSDVFIGDIGVTRCAHGELMGLNGIDWEKKAMLEGKNNDLPVGDPSIIWSFGGELYIQESHSSSSPYQTSSPLLITVRAS